MIPSGIAASFKPQTEVDIPGFAFSPGYKSTGLTLSANSKTLEKTEYDGRPSTAACRHGKLVGKYYFELFIEARPSGSEIGVGVGTWLHPLSLSIGIDSFSIGYLTDGRVVKSGSAVAFLDTYGVGDTVCVAVDCDNRTVRFRKNDGVWTDALNTPTLHPVMPMVHMDGLGGKVSLRTSSSELSFEPYPGYSVWQVNTDEPPARYWRYYKIRGVVTPGLFGVTEWRLFDTLGGANITPSGTLTASSAYSSPSLAADGDTSTFWTSFWNSEPPNYISCDFGVGGKSVVRSLGLQRLGVTEGIPTDICLVYSYDNVVFHPAAGASHHAWVDTDTLDLIVN